MSFITFFFPNAVQTILLLIEPFIPLTSIWLDFCLITIPFFYNEIVFLLKDIDDCLPDPCENNGTCTDLVNDYQCNCMLGFNETNCENSKHF